MQWVLFRLKRGAELPLDADIPAKKLRPLAFCRTKAALVREIREEQLILTASTYEPVKPASAATDAPGEDVKEEIEENDRVDPVT